MRRGGQETIVEHRDLARSHSPQDSAPGPRFSQQLPVPPLLPPSTIREAILPVPPSTILPVPLLLLSLLLLCTFLPLVSPLVPFMSPPPPLKLGFVGYGTIAHSIAAGLLSQPAFEVASVHVSRRSAAKSAAIEARHPGKVTVCDDN